MATFSRFMMKGLDFLLRGRNSLRHKLKEIYSGVKEVSESEDRFYVQAVERIVAHPKKFARFRRIYNYREVLEHVSFAQGKLYISRILHLEPTLLNSTLQFQANDATGKPYIHNYPNIGKFSPTTLRYISVAAEIRSLFGNEVSGDFAEIGVGYGGQFSVLNETQRISSYSMFDLVPVLELVRKYLSSFGNNQVKLNKVIFEDLRELPDKNWDLVISNYAFSELPKSLQLDYVEKVLTRSKRGYLIMNSGKSNISGFSKGKLTLKELEDLLPGVEILEEVPNTGPDNYVLVWGHK